MRCGWHGSCFAGLLESAHTRTTWHIRVNTIRVSRCSMNGSSGASMSTGAIENRKLAAAETVGRQLWLLDE